MGRYEDIRKGVTPRHGAVTKSSEFLGRRVANAVSQLLHGEKSGLSGSQSATLCCPEMSSRSQFFQILLRERTLLLNGRKALLRSGIPGVAY